MKLLIVFAALSFSAFASITIVSTIENLVALNEGAIQAGNPEYQLADSTIQAIRGQDEEDLERQLRMLGNYQIPIGLVSKLLELQSFNTLYFIIDDSSSMLMYTDSFHLNGDRMTRWDEAIMRIRMLLEITAHFPIQRLKIGFLNRPFEIDAPMQYLGNPEAFSGRLIDMIASHSPCGRTPVLGALRRALDTAGSK